RVDPERVVVVLGDEVDVPVGEVDDDADFGPRDPERDENGGEARRAAAMRRLIVDLGTPSSRAAAESDPRSAASTKVPMSSRPMMRGIAWLRNSNLKWQTCALVACMHRVYKGVFSKRRS